MSVFFARLEAKTGRFYGGALGQKLFLAARRSAPIRFRHKDLQHHAVRGADSVAEREACYRGNF
jgi:hypothetical protein